MSDDLRRFMMIVEGDVVDLGRHKMNKARDKVGGLVSGFQAYLDSLERFKAEFGQFEPMLRDYKESPSPRQVPVFMVEVSFDHMAKGRDRARLRKAGFRVSKDSPDWGTPVHDNEQTRSWANGAYYPANGRNWYTQTSAEKQITPDLAQKLWIARNQPQVQARYGLYRAKEVHYHKGNLAGDAEAGWDIRSHPEHASHYLSGMSFRIALTAPDYSQDVAIKDDASMQDALRVHAAIQRAESIRLSGATNVTDLSDLRP